MTVSYWVRNSAASDAKGNRLAGHVVDGRPVIALNARHHLLSMAPHSNGIVGSTGHLARFEEQLAEQIERSQGLRAQDIRRIAVDIHRTLRSTFNSSETLPRLVRTAHMGTLTSFPSDISKDENVLAFWRQRYPALPSSGDTEEAYRWRAVLLALASQVSLCHRLLAGTGNVTTNVVEVKTNLQYGPWAPMDPTRRRLKELKEAVILAQQSEPGFRAALHLPVAPADDRSIEQRLRGQDTLWMCRGQNGDVHGALGFRRYAADEKHNAWPLELPLGGKRLNVPSRLASRMGLVQLTHFSFDPSFFTSVPLCAAQSLILEFPSDLVDWKIE